MLVPKYLTGNYLSTIAWIKSDLLKSKLLQVFKCVFIIKKSAKKSRCNQDAKQDQCHQHRPADLLCLKIETKDLMHLCYSNFRPVWLFFKRCKTQMMLIYQISYSNTDVIQETFPEYILVAEGWWWPVKLFQATRGWKLKVTRLCTQLTLFVGAAVPADNFTAFSLTFIELFYLALLL